MILRRMADSFLTGDQAPAEILMVDADNENSFDRYLWNQIRDLATNEKWDVKYGAAFGTVLMSFTNQEEYDQFAVSFKKYIMTGTYKPNITLKESE